MSKNSDSIAFHEAGHAVAHILADIPFRYVTIKEETEMDENGERSLGRIVTDETSPQISSEYSFVIPDQFCAYFKEDFTRVAGLIAERIYRGRFNYKAAKSDFRQIVGTTLEHLPEVLESKYLSFLLEYTYHVLHSRTTWSDITAVALALVEEETLTYQMVLNVIEQNKVNPVLK
jgi:hypothetical protein